MQEIQLSARLQAVLHAIPSGGCLADIGSDHAYIPCQAIRAGIVSRAIAGEVREGPFRQSVLNVRAYGLETSVDVRFGDGLDVIAGGEADTIVIAGMGGELIVHLLERGSAKIEKASLVLQPNIREPLCRGWLAAHGWLIERETIVEEASHFYEIIRARKAGSGECAELSESELLLGPQLLIQKQTIFLKKWNRRANKLRQILGQLRAVKHNDAASERRHSCFRELSMIEAVLNGQATAAQTSQKAKE
ncbi:MAG: class I SAM-dependent methyltransferase [Sporolactobacillus sp.]